MSISLVLERFELFGDISAHISAHISAARAALYFELYFQLFGNIDSTEVHVGVIGADVQILVSFA